MLESYNNRIKFNRKNIQKNFILKAKEYLRVSNIELSKRLEINPRTLADWSREKFNMSYEAALKLSQLTKLPIPKGYKIIKWTDHLKKIGKTGGDNRFALYGRVATDEEYRNKKWKEWWEKTGQYKNNHPGFQSLIKIKIPQKSKKLAEFVGIILGDGGLAPYHIQITLSNEEEGYKQYIIKLIVDLFGTVPKIHRLKYAKAINIVVQRKQLVDFCQDAGLVKGNKIKYQIDIPNWVKENKEFSKVCVRGLVDTDGCFYRNSYWVNGKKYTYFKICFTSASTPLIKSVSSILMELGLKIVITKTNREVRIVDAKSVLQYIKIIGSHNQKHLDKIKAWKNLRSWRDSNPRGLLKGLPL